MTDMKGLLHAEGARIEIDSRSATDRLERVAPHRRSADCNVSRCLGLFGTSCCPTRGEHGLK